MRMRSPSLVIFPLAWMHVACDILGGYETRTQLKSDKSVPYVSVNSTLSLFILSRLHSQGTSQVLGQGIALPSPGGAVCNAELERVVGRAAVCVRKSGEIERFELRRGGS